MSDSEFLGEWKQRKSLQSSSGDSSQPGPLVDVAIGEWTRAIRHCDALNRPRDSAHPTVQEQVVADFGSKSAKGRTPDQFACCPPLRAHSRWASTLLKHDGW